MQRNDLILSDVFTCRDIALRKIGLMKDGPYPHKREAKHAGSSMSETAEEPRTRTTTNSLVTMRNRNMDAIRIKVIQSAEEFLMQHPSSRKMS